MRHHLRLIALAALCAAPASLLAQSVYFKSGAKEERWDLNDPFAAPGTKKDPAKAVWKDRAITLEKDGVETNRKPAAIIRIEWPNEPAQLAQARDFIARGESAKALSLVEPVLRLFDPVRKVPGSLWLKAAEVKLDALSGLSNEAVLSSFIALLEENDDGSVPGLAGKIKLAKLFRQVRAGDHASVLVESDKLLGELEDPDMQARILVLRADSQLALRKFEDALNTYLRVPVFFGSEKAFLPAAYLGTAKAMRALSTPLNKAQRLDESSQFYLREIIRDFPASKEAAEARALLPKEDRDAEDKRALGGDTAAAPAKETPEKTDEKAKPETDAAPAE